MKRYLKPCVLLLLAMGLHLNDVHAINFRITVNFHPEAISIGPKIKLGEISQISVKNQRLRCALDSLVITDAAISGEAKEISISFIKKKLRESGLDLNQICFKGSRIIRITTLTDNLINLIIENQITQNNHLKKKLTNRTSKQQTRNSHQFFKQPFKYI